MKKFLEILICCAIALGIGAGCKTEPGTPPDPTPGPVGTAVPVPTEVPTPKPIVPCKSTGLHVYTGDCQASDTCRDGSDGFFYGKACNTKEAM